MRRCAFPLSLLLFFATSPSLVGESQWHVVAKGDTLYSVARDFGVSVSAIEEANAITDPSLLRIGQRLLIPNVHKVAKGETLYGIARTAATTVQELRHLNGLSDSTPIRIGQILVLPSAEGSIARTGAVSGPADRSTGQGSSPSASTSPTTQPLASAPTSSSTQPSPAPPTSAVPSTAQPSSASKAAGSEDGQTDRPSSSADSAKATEVSSDLPCAGTMRYLDGKVYGIAIRSHDGELVHSVTDGSVVSAGPYRGFGSVVFVQTGSGLIYVYGGNKRVDVKVGDRVRVGEVVGRVGTDAFTGTTDAYFFVFRGSKALDPATASRN